LLALIGGIVGTTWGLLRAELAREAEAEQRRIAQAKKQEAEREKGNALTAAREEKRAKDDAVQAREAEAKERKKAEGERDAKSKALVRADGLRLVAQSSAELHTDPSLGLLLAIEAARLAPSKEASGALYAALDTCREERTFFGHQGEVFSARFTPDGKRIMSCGSDGTVRFWDVPSGKQLLLASGVGQPGYGISADAVLSPDGKYFVTLHRGTVFYYKPDGKRIEYTDRVTRLWDAGTGKQLAVLRGHKSQVRTAAFSADSKRLVTSACDTTARVWEIPSGKPLAVLQGHACAPYSASFSPDGRQVLTISSGYDSLDPSGGAPSPAAESDPEEIRVPQPATGHGYYGGGYSWGVNSEREKILARAWDAETGKEVVTLLRPTGFFGSQFEVPSFGHFSPDGKQVALGFMQDVQIWDIGTGKLLFRLKHGGMSSEDHVAWSPDGKRLATHPGKLCLSLGCHGRQRADDAAGPREHAANGVVQSRLQAGVDHVLGPDRPRLEC
jgi:WD40 repeat protein